HDRQRGGRTYRKIKETVRAAQGPRTGGSREVRLNVTLHCCLTSLNVETIEALVEEWRAEPVRGIVFDFYTPVRGLEESLWMGWERRERAIERLLAAKDRWGDFIRVPRGLFKAMRRKE